MTPQPNDQWIFSTPRNGLFVLVDGKPQALRITKHQMDAYMAYLKTQEAENKERADARMKAPKGDQPAGLENRMSEIVQSMGIDSLAIVEIAMNPTEGAHDFPKERIEKLFDYDQIRIIASEWMERKIFQTLAHREKDPLLAAVPLSEK